MIYQLQIITTRRFSALVPKTYEDVLFEKEAFTLDGTEYEDVMRLLNEHAKGRPYVLCNINNENETGVRVYVWNRIKGNVVFASDNYVYIDKESEEYFVEMLRYKVAPPKNWSKIVKWVSMTFIVFFVMFCFKMCKAGWDKEVNPYSAHNWKGGIYYKMSAADKQLGRDIEIIEKGGDPRTYRLNGDTCKEDLTWKDLHGNKKAYRRLFLKKILMMQPDLYRGRNGERLQFPNPELRNHGYLEAEIDKDTLYLYGIGSNDRREFESWVNCYAKCFFDCGFVWVKGYNYNKVYISSSQKRGLGQFNARILLEEKRIMIKYPGKWKQLKGVMTI